MIKRILLWSIGALLLGLAGFGVWLYSLPPAPAASRAPAIAAAEVDATLAALKSRNPARPLIAIIGLNDATETTDYLMPTGILRRADIADVVMLATATGPVTLYPALKVMPDATVAEFDARHPGGADYVIVPAMSRDDDPAVLGWLKGQAAKGGTIIGVCAGAKIVAAAGLLDGKRATTHWYFRKEMLEKHPSIRYVADRRFVVDERIATTTGITASMPMMLTLVEAIAGREKALAVARDLGLEHWGAHHDSSAFAFTRPFAISVLGNTLAFWNRDELGMQLQPGVDEVSLALVADAWSRTYRSRAITFARSGEAIASRNGLRILPDNIATEWPADRLVATVTDRPAGALDQALLAIANRYGVRTADVVAMQLEYPQLLAENESW